MKIKFQRIANGRALVKAGYGVIHAGGGNEGLRIAREDIPDLILLDMMLPKHQEKLGEVNNVFVEVGLAKPSTGRNRKARASSAGLLLCFSSTDLVHPSAIP